MVTVSFLEHKKGVVQVQRKFIYAVRDGLFLSAPLSIVNSFCLAMPSPTYGPGSVPSGQSAPFIVASSTDHSASIVIVAATGVALIIITLTIRIYIRSNFSGPWLVDDTVFVLATVRDAGSEHLGLSA